MMKGERRREHDKWLLPRRWWWDNYESQKKMREWWQQKEDYEINAKKEVARQMKEEGIEWRMIKQERGQWKND